MDYWTDSEARMTTKVSFDHNAESVIGDIEDIKFELQGNIRKRIQKAMSLLKYNTQQNILNDAQTTGMLFSTVESDVSSSPTKVSGEVSVGGEQRPSAAVTEYGSGYLSGQSFRTSKRFVPVSNDRNPPPQYPFESPTVTPENIDGFAYYIEEWMKAKGLTPKKGSYTESAYAIARTIGRAGTYAHPFLRPAWYKNKYRIRKQIKRAVKNSFR